MNESEKLYENAGLETLPYCCDYTCGEPTKRCKDCPDFREIYPPFTAEKQLELIKWLVQNSYRNYFTIDYSFDKKLWRCKCNLSDSDYEFIFEESLASLINSLWQDITTDEKQKIKEILE